MSRIVGWLIGLGYVGLVAYTYGKAQAGWDAGHTDVGFWWAVVAGFLAIAALALFIGTWIHTRPQQH